VHKISGLVYGFMKIMCYNIIKENGKSKDVSPETQIAICKTHMSRCL